MKGWAIKAGSRWKTFMNSNQPVTYDTKAKASYILFGRERVVRVEIREVKPKRTAKSVENVGVAVRAWESSERAKPKRKEKRK